MVVFTNSKKYCEMKLDDTSEILTMNRDRPRFCRIVTAPITFRMQLPEQLRCMADAGFDLTLVCSPDDGMDDFARDVGARFIPIPMTRRISPVRDGISILAMARLFRRERFDLVHSSTPKAGLVTAVAGVLARVPIRIHTFTGQPWTELKGPKRVAAINADRLIARLATHLYVDGGSQRDFLAQEGIAPASRLRVLASGSLTGVNLARFDPAALAPEREAVRRELGIPEDACVIGFMGRLARDKGIAELLAAFGIVAAARDKTALILIGPDDAEGKSARSLVKAATGADRRIHAVGFVERPEAYLAGADIFCLPSYREGFNLAILGAAALGLPVVATRINGIRDAVSENETGLLVPPKDVPALASALAVLADDPAARRRMGAAARVRTRTLFDANVVNGALIAEYRRLMAK